MTVYFATCACGEKMNVDTCKHKHIMIGGIPTLRIPYPPTSTKNCHDCNIWPGGVHHEGCDMEKCPICKGQLISCDCDIQGSTV